MVTYHYYAKVYFCTDYQVEIDGIARVPTPIADVADYFELKEEIKKNLEEFKGQLQQVVIMSLSKL